MIALNDYICDDVTTSCGTADCNYRTGQLVDADITSYLDLAGRTRCDADITSYLDLAGRTRWIKQNRMILFERLGAVLGRNGGFVRYWSRKKLLLIFFRKLFKRTIYGFYSGFV